MRTLLAAITALSLTARFAGLENAPFTLDEPQLLSMAWDWVSGTGPAPRLGLMGTQGVPYGAAPIWMYALGQWLAGPSPHIALLAAVTASAAAILLMSIVIRRRVGPDGALWFAALAATSPYLSSYSRMAWDNPWQLFFSALAFFAADRLVPLRLVRIEDRQQAVQGVSLLQSLGLGNQRRWSVLLGAALGLLVSTHLMAVPLALVIAYWAGRELVRYRSWNALSLALGSFATAVFPYFLGLREQSVGSSLQSTASPLSLSSVSFDRWIHAWHHFWAALDAPSRLLSLEGFHERLDLPEIPEPWNGLVLLGWLARGLAFAGLWWVIRHRKRKATQLEKALAAAWLGLALLLFFKTPVIHAHYGLGAVWASLYFAVVALDRLHGRPGKVARALGFALVAGHSLYWGMMVHSLGLSHGTRGTHYGMSLSQQEKRVRESCKLEQVPAEHLVKLPGVTLPALRYLTRIEPECYGLKDLK